MKKFSYFLFFPVMFIFSCKTSTVVINKKEIKTISASNLFDSLVVNYANFSTFQTKMKLSVKADKKSNSLMGILRMSKDSMIWMSLNPGFGIEVARTKMNNDSIVFLDRFNKSYYNGDYNNINTLLGVDLDYKLIQSIFLNTLYFYGCTDSSGFPKDLIIKKDKNGKEIEMINISKRKIKRSDNSDELPPIYQRVKIDNTNLKVKELIFKDFKEDKTLNIEYLNYVYIDSIKTEFPQTIDIKITSKLHNFHIILKYSGLIFNCLNEYSLTIPSTYKPIILKN